MASQAICVILAVYPAQGLLYIRSTYQINFYCINGWINEWITNLITREDNDFKFLANVIKPPSRLFESVSLGQVNYVPNKSKQYHMRAVGGGKNAAERKSFPQKQTHSRTLKSEGRLSCPVLFFKLTKYQPSHQMTLLQNISVLNNSWYMTRCQHPFIEYIFLRHIMANIQVSTKSPPHGGGNLISGHSSGNWSPLILSNKSSKWSQSSKEPAPPTPQIVSALLWSLIEGLLHACSFSKYFLRNK